jgi:hypothetical protein
VAVVLHPQPPGDWRAAPQGAVQEPAKSAHQQAHGGTHQQRRVITDYRGGWWGGGVSRLRVCNSAIAGRPCDSPHGTAWRVRGWTGRARSQGPWWQP